MLETTPSLAQLGFAEDLKLHTVRQPYPIVAFTPEAVPLLFSAHKLQLAKGELANSEAIWTSDE